MPIENARYSPEKTVLNHLKLSLHLYLSPLRHVCKILTYGLLFYCSKTVAGLKAFLGKEFVEMHSSLNVLYIGNALMV